MSVSGGFPVDYSVEEDTTFEFVVRDIANPTYSGTTGDFWGSVLYPNMTKNVGINQFSLSITTGYLGVDLSIDPTTVNVQSDLIVTITPEHAIPASGGWLSIRLNSNTWPKSNSISPNNIFKTTPSCQAVSVKTHYIVECPIQPLLHQHFVRPLCAGLGLQHLQQRHYFWQSLHLFVQDHFDHQPALHLGSGRVCLQYHELRFEGH